MESIPKGLCEGPIFVYALRSVTEAAARAAYEWIGRGERHQVGQAAAQAMIDELIQLPIHGRVVVGESLATGSGSLCLCTGDEIGDGHRKRRFDIAVDPVEGTSYLARGMTNAMAVIALAPQGSMFDPGPAFYMEKFVAPPAAKGRVDPAAPVEARLAALAAALGKRIEDLTVYVLEKPRHRELVERIHGAGARVALYPAGDVAGALMAAIPESGIDALMGTGGVREGLISACAIRALGGEFQGRLDPQLATEKAEVAKAGLDTRRWLGGEDLIRSDEVYFSATGVTTGLLFDGVERTRHHEKTQSLLIAGPGSGRQLLTTYHPRREAV
ncbi:MAG: class II fructose-bisphosphatase [Magnetospirillum sp. WYHS-4]